MQLPLVVVTIVLAVVSSVPLGLYMARVFTGGRTWLDPLVVPIEHLVLFAAGVDPSVSQDWRGYARSLVLSNAWFWTAAFFMVTSQGWLPLNPDHAAGMEPTLAFNTIASFVTNTNLQHYSGETGLSYLAQLFVVVFLQFVTAASGMAAAVAVFRALGSQRRHDVGNFYVDTTRAGVRVLLPLALVVAVTCLWQGTPMTFDGAQPVATVEGGTQVIARGPVAAEVAIKQLGTNGGGFFGPNSTHPFENPTPLTNLVQTLSILAIPMGMVWTLGAMIDRRRVSAVIFATMLALYLPLVTIAVQQEAAGSPAIAAMGVDQSGGSMEGKEVRVGVFMTALWAVSTTSTSNGSVNGMHDSLTPLGGLTTLAGMWLNSIFGGVGVGMLNMLIYIILTVFVAGMMIGRTPEFLGKRVEAREMTLASLTMVLHPLLILGGTAGACYLWATTADPGTALHWLKNPGAHGFSEMVYEFSSAAANNGSGFEGLGDNTAFWNISTGLVMILARYIPIIAPLALAASLAGKTPAPETAGSLGADTPIFGLMLWGVVVILGLLMFLPVAVLGPVAEHLALQ